MPDPGFVPLGEALPYWPSQVAERPAFLNQVGIQEFDVVRRESPEEVEVTGSLVWFQEFVIELAAIPGFSIAFLHDGDATVVDFEVHVLPEVGVRLPSIDVDLRLDNPLLRPVESTNGSWEPKLDSSGDPVPLTVSMTGIGLEADLEGNVEIVGSPVFDLGAVAVADTGVVLELEGVRPFLSRELTPPDGAPEGFRGLGVDSVKLHLPEELDIDVAPDRIEGSELLVGSDGFSGIIQGTWDAPTFDPDSGTFADGDGVGSLFGLPFALLEIGITLQQSTVAGSTIRGTMVLPFFDEPINVEVGLAESGLTVALAAEQPEGVEHDAGLVTFEKEGVLEATVKSLAFETSGDGPFTVSVAGTLTPLAGGVDWPGVEVKSLSIDAEGNVDVEGGWIDLPDQYQVDFHGFQLELSRLGLGSNEDGSRWLGLDGELKLVEGLPAGASAEGLRITWDQNGVRGVSFDGVGIEFDIEGVLRFDGEVAYLEDGDEHRFQGAIDLDLVSLGLQIDAQLVVGRRDGYTFLAIFVGADLPAGIPLFTTGLSLYGMAGLYAQHMEPGRGEEQRWYSLERPKSWYHADEPGVAVLSKWEASRGSVALGAGVTIGTASDNGYAFNGELLLVVLVPGPVIMLEGRANLMKERAELDAAPPNFRTLAVLDNRAGNFTFGLDAQYRFDEEKGRLLDIRAGAEAYYDFSDPLAWYCHLGEREPRDRRIAARMYDLFESTAYYMLDARGVELGAAVGYDLEKSAGPLKVELEAWIEAAAALSWMPPHFFGELLVHGLARLSAFGVGLGVSLDARIAADVFDPFHLIGTFSVALETPPLLPDPSADVTLEWGPIPDPPPLPLPLKGVVVEHFKSSAKWPLPRSPDEGPALLRPDYDADGTGFRTEPEGADDAPPPGEMPVVPVDGRPHLTFTQPVRDRAGVGVDPADVGWVRIGDPQKGEGPAKARFDLTAVVLERAHGPDWIPVARAPAGDDDLPTLFGSWAPTPPLPLDAESTADTDHTPVKLWLWSKNPFAYSQRAGREWEDWFLGENASFPCVDVPEQGRHFYDVEEATVDERLGVEQDGADRTWTSRDGVTFRWNEEAFEFGRRGAIELRRGERRVFSDEAWRDEDDHVERILQRRVEQSVLRIGQSPRRRAVERVVSDFFIELDEPYRRPLMPETEERTDYAFVLDPRVVEPGPGTPTDACLPSSLHELGLSRALEFEFPTGEHPSLILTMELPRSHARVVLDLCIDFASDLTLLGFDEDGRLTGWTQESTTDSGRVTLTLEGEESVRTLSLHGAETAKKVHVLRLEGLDVPPETIDERRRLAEHLQEETRRWEQNGNVLEPNQTYRLRVETEVEARGEDELAGYEETLEQTEFAYFRTGGPPAVPAVRADGSSLDGFTVPVGHANPSRFSSGLDDLGPYVDQTVPRTVTDGGGPPREPDSVYRSYDVGVRFDEDYVELMYRQSGRDLGLYLYDSNDRPARDNRGRILTANNHWGNTEELELADHDGRWIETLRERDCVSVAADRIPHPSTLTARAHGQTLRAKTAHEARLVPMLLHETFRRITLQGWSAVHGQRRDWSLDRSTNVQSEVDRVEGSVVHVDGSADLFRVEPGLDLLVFSPTTADIRPAYRILAVDPDGDTVTIAGRPGLFENTTYDIEITRPGAVRHTSVTGGAGTDPLRSGALLTRGDTGWSDYRVSALVRSDSSGSGGTPEGSVGVAFRCQGDRYYRFALHADPAVRRLTRVEGSSATVLDDEEHEYDSDRDYRLAVEAAGDRLRAYQDGVLVFDVEDDAIDAGGVGLYAWKNDGAEFRDVRIEDLSQSARSAYRFSFVTSRFAHFRHHLHSHQAETWPASIDADEVSRSDLERTVQPAVDQADVYDEPGDDGAAAYDALARQALGSRAQSFPDRVETTRVVHDGDPVAWLVRSPEPIDWRRTGLHVHRASGDRARSTVPGDVKIMGAEYGPSSDEHLDLLVRRSTSLDGAGVEYRRRTPGAEPTDLPGSDDVFEGLLLDARFEEPLGEEWTTVDQAPYSDRSSGWHVQDGELHQTENYYGFVGGMVNAPGTYVVTGESHWTDCRVSVGLRSDDDDAIGVLFRYVDRDNYYRFSMDRQRGYRRLIRKRDGDVSVLWEDGDRYQVGHDYALRIDCRGPRLEAWLDGEALFDVNDDVHPAGRVGLYCRANRAARFDHLRVLAPLEDWKLYHTFEDDTEWTDGTVFRLHSSGGFSPSATVEDVRAGQAPDADPAFSPYGTDVRVVGADGSVLHERHLAATDEGGFGSTDLRLLRRADGTGFALVRQSSQGAIEPLKAGTYRLSFTYRRDNRAHTEDSMVLRQNGDASAERVEIDTPWQTLRTE